MKQYDVIVLGAGLAGLSTAAHLIEREKSIRILVFDPNKTGAGASSVPAGMVNPATGQNARIAWEADTCLQMLKHRIDSLSPFAPEPLFNNKGVMRPAIDEKLNQRFRTAFMENKWPKGVAEWLSPEEVKLRVPYLKSSSGALYLKKGMVVRTPAYLNAYVAYLKEKGVDFHFGGGYNLHEEKPWRVETKTLSFSAPVVILAAGYKSRHHRYWSKLPLHSVKGQLAIYQCSEEVHQMPAVSAYGYIASVESGKIVVGSTYEHHFENEHPDFQAAHFLDHKFKELMPDLYKKSKRTSLWSGIRATTPDRLPATGEHPTKKGLYIYAGLGSKGLLFSEYIAFLLARHLTQKEALPEELSLYRFSRIRAIKERFLKEKI